MKRPKWFYLATASALAGLLLAYGAQKQGIAQENAQYVGPDTCAQCHPDVVKTWAMTVHRRTLFNENPAMKGCEACHGPGQEHVEGGGDPEMIIRPEKLKPEQTAAICTKCHTQERLTLWQTSLHARAKLACTDCHDPHSPDTRMLSKDIENGKLQLEGLTRSIKDAELAAATAAEGSEEQAAANEEVSRLKAERDKLLKTVKGAETVYKRTAEPYLCYNCHKIQQVQSNMPSHHPIVENEMKCSDCHNPHGGPDRMLRGESVNETCFRCHAEKLGPFVFDHPPVSEDCTICHNPHGSVQNNLLVQSEPFVCLKCHPGPHSRSGSLGSAQSMATYYTECTDCHSQVHGSDEHGALHY